MSTKPSSKKRLVFRGLFAAGAICCGILISVSSAVGQADENGDQFLSYKLEGGQTNQRIVVTILNSGATIVSIEKPKEKPNSYSTSLSFGELEHLKTLIDSTDFFLLPDSEEILRLHTGETRLTVVREGQAKTLIFGSRPALDPLRNFVWSLVAQAKTAFALKFNTDIYTAMSALIPTSAGMKALQPQQLKSPLIAFVKKSEERQKIVWVLEGLAAITSAEDFSGLVASEIAKPERNDIALESISNSINLPDSHNRALCPLFLNFVKKNYPRRSELSENQAWALERFTQLLGELQYEPAIPLFLNRLETHPQPTPSPDYIPLSKMGLLGVRAMIPCLDSPEDLVRSNAIELLLFSSRGNPRSEYADPFSTAEYAEMVKLFQDPILNRLTEIAESDASRTVREIALAAILEMRSEIAK